MAITDPISDLLTRIRNAQQCGVKYVKVPHSNIKLQICTILKDEGMLDNVQVVSDGTAKQAIKITLKYISKFNPLIRRLNRVSKPSRRVYVAKKDIPKPLNGFGVSILSTSKGVLSGREARLKNVGGELLAVLY